MIISMMRNNRTLFNFSAASLLLAISLLLILIFISVPTILTGATALTILTAMTFIGLASIFLLKHSIDLFAKMLTEPAPLETDPQQSDQDKINKAASLPKREKRQQANEDPLIHYPSPLSRSPTLSSHPRSDESSDDNFLQQQVTF